MTFDDLLSLEVNCGIVASDTAALLIIGEGSAALTEVLCRSEPDTMRVRLQCVPAPAKVLFGLPVLTAPFPILVQTVMTERNTQLNQLSLFAWIEDNGILEPRAEVIGLTPFGEQPVLFLRDVDLDRPPEAWLRSPQPARWMRVSGVALADPAHIGEPMELHGDGAALAALEWVLPADAQPFLAGLRAEADKGTPLRAALRQRRRTTDARLMHVCDGWRVLARAARFIRLNPARDPRQTWEGVAQNVRLSLPRAW
ncbi:MAG: hypothetical protein RMN25_07240 [Anaerolineae bacterium]|nr:hypothetical protein [Thermoflexales bacterium]MDW8407563.1 hypothetical protein [Anaerolineae bacterium]